MVGGKIPPNMLKRFVFSSLGVPANEMVVGPAIGEDAAVLHCEEGYLVIASDPVTGATENIGLHVVHANANDLAATGADPRYFMVTILLTGNESSETLKIIMGQIDAACKEVGATVIGGHTEVTPGIDHTIISGTMLGVAKTFIPTSGARPGDALILTKGAGIEGTSILAHEKARELEQALGVQVVRKAQEYAQMLSVLPEARILRPYATALHDPTEGGVSGALNEMAIAAGCGFRVERADVPVSDVTQSICEHFGCDPLELISSGSLLATVPPESAEIAMEALRRAGIASAVIGTMDEKEKTLPMPERDALWDLL